MPTPTNTAYRNLDRAIAGYSYLAYNDARRLVSTELVTGDARITGDAEDFYGTLRWYNSLGDLNHVASGGTGDDARTNVNVSGFQTENEGALTRIATNTAQYAKAFRTHGADEYNATQAVTQQPGAIARVGRDFGRTQALDEDSMVISALKGVIGEEKSNSAASVYGQQNPDALEPSAGFYVDLNSPALHNRLNGDVTGFTPVTDNATKRGNKLVDLTRTGGRALAGIFAAEKYAYSDLPVEFMYLVVSPSDMLDLMSANLIDEDRATDGNVQFVTILNGKYRLIQTRSDLGNYTNSGNAAAGDNVNKGSTRTSLLAMPGSIAFVRVRVPVPVAFDRDESRGMGAGKQELWWRWSYIVHPRGYSYTTAPTDWVTNANFEAAASWQRKENIGNLGILPIFHS